MTADTDTLELARRLIEAVAWEVVMPDGERRIMAVMSDAAAADWREHDCAVNPLYRGVPDASAEIERLREALKKALKYCEVVSNATGIEPKHAAELRTALKES